MPTVRPMLAAAIVMILLSGCAYRNNFPVTQAFPIAPDDSATLRIYVDGNGTFFPNKWRERCGATCTKIRRGFSLLQTGFGAPDYAAHIAAEEKRQLAIVADYMATRRRIFILVHGFNTDEDDARASYNRIRDRIAPQDRDGIIEFYWDGLAKLPSKNAFSLAPLAFWRKATNNSQTAGVRGLRRVLAQATGREIFLISHSRGASVVLSALSNPPFRTGVDHSRNFESPAPLPSGSGNRIRLLLLAPAIGCLDFSRVDRGRRPTRKKETAGCVDVRPLRPEVTFFGYTLNPNDRVLSKFVLPSDWYSATDFGFKPKLGAELGARWNVMRAFPIAKPHGHDFDCYVADPEFGDMLKAADVSLNANPKLGPRKPCTKKETPQRKP
jgi:hypothetical protein